MDKKEKEDAVIAWGIEVEHKLYDKAISTGRQHLEAEIGLYGPECEYDFCRLIEVFDVAIKKSIAAQEYLKEELLSQSPYSGMEIFILGAGGYALLASIFASWIDGGDHDYTSRGSLNYVDFAGICLHKYLLDEADFIKDQTIDLY